MSLDDELFQDAVRDPFIRRWLELGITDLRILAELGELAQEAGGMEAITSEMKRRPPGWTNGPAAAAERIMMGRQK